MKNPISYADDVLKQILLLAHAPSFFNVQKLTSCRFSLFKFTLNQIILNIFNSSYLCVFRAESRKTATKHEQE